MTVSEFIAKWGKVQLTERSVAWLRAAHRPLDEAVFVAQGSTRA